MKEITGERGGRGRVGNLFLGGGLFIGCVVFFMLALCVQEWGLDNNTVCAVPLSDLLQFLLPLLLLYANIKGRR